MDIKKCPIGSGTLEAFLVDSPAPLPGVIICPGGGYMFCADREAAPVARTFNSMGFNAFVLTYQCDGHPLTTTPLRQLSWAVSAVRQNTSVYNTLSDKLAVLGFSAGGHLAASLGVFWNNSAMLGDDLEPAAVRPDAMILCYPVISSGTMAHRGSFENLAGQDRAAQDEFSLEKHVCAQTPPAFLWHPVDDEMVPVENSLLFCDALRKNGVTHELHLYPHGIHGLSLATPEVDEPAARRISDAHIATWAGLAGGFLNFLFSKKR